MSQLKVNSIIPVAGVPTGGGGGIIQVKQTVKTSFFSLSTTDTVTDVTGVSVAITHTSNTSKIFVMVSGERSENNGNSFGMFFLSRVISSTTTDLAIGDSRGSSIRCTMSAMKLGGTTSASNLSQVLAIPFNIQFLDSPSTTSECTYKLRLTNAHTGTISVGGTFADDDDNRTSTPTIITAMEVSA